VIGFELIIRNNPQLKFDIKNLEGWGNCATVPGATGREGASPDKGGLFKRGRKPRLAVKGEWKWL
jgi:hypothetical protein